MFAGESVEAPNCNIKRRIVSSPAGDLRIHVRGRSKRITRTASGLLEDGRPAEGEGSGGASAATTHRQTRGVTPTGVKRCS